MSKILAFITRPFTSTALVLWRQRTYTKDELLERIEQKQILIAANLIGERLEMMHEALGMNGIILDRALGIARNRVHQNFNMNNGAKR